jgi:hypothetical protein
LRVAAFALVAFIALASPLVAAPRSIGDCEAIKQADDYNRCLARFGPAAHTGPAKGETPVASGEAAVVPANADRMKPRNARRHHVGRGRASRHAVHVETRGRHGRVRATFAVEGR